MRGYDEPYWAGEDICQECGERDALDGEDYCADCLRDREERYADPDDLLDWGPPDSDPHDRERERP